MRRLWDAGWWGSMLVSPRGPGEESPRTSSEKRQNRKAALGVTTTIHLVSQLGIVETFTPPSCCQQKYLLFSDIEGNTSGPNVTPSGPVIV